MISYNWVSFFLLIAPFLLSMLVEWRLYKKYSTLLPPQLILHLSRCVTIVFFILAAMVIDAKGWLNTQGLQSFLSLHTRALWATLILGAVMLTATTLMAKKGLTGDRPKQYLPMTLPRLIIYTVVWMAYLLAYEVFIRGFLLPGTLGAAILPGEGDTNAILLAGAIVANALFYGAIHLPKGRQEALGALVFGLVAAPLTLWAGSVWPVFIAHAILSLQMDVRPTWRQNVVR
ncbi:MAG TPA: CPBP family intramembrane glutamic endopeptidase [Phnomibacter sp.]|nr:CPBP family intramembrane glutamic endopeptidase [Phnomibacter sp.]